MSVSGKDLECSGVPVMATERDDMRNQSWTDAQQPCYACEMIITTAGINQAMILDVSSRWLLCLCLDRAFESHTG